MNLDEAIKNQDAFVVVWLEPWQGRDVEGFTMSAHVELRATVRHAIAMQRHAAHKMAKADECSDLDRLIDFMAIHWARIEKSTNRKEIICTRKDDISLASTAFTAGTTGKMWLIHGKARVA